ncbi:hypothetical protein [Streptomyces sp. NPDC046712]|uniref:hypothetical protein n=1 Tax=Streptomyces sp. NPDC046712 TaxID=3154802 RepID=UPI0033E7C4E3
MAAAYERKHATRVLRGARDGCGAGHNGPGARLVDRLPARLPYAKAVGIQPRTLEIWDRMGLARAVLEA